VQLPVSDLDSVSVPVSKFQLLWHSSLSEIMSALDLSVSVCIFLLLLANELATILALPLAVLTVLVLLLAFCGRSVFVIGCWPFLCSFGWLPVINYQQRKTSKAAHETVINVLAWPEIPKRRISSWSCRYKCSYRMWYFWYSLGFLLCDEKYHFRFVSSCLVCTSYLLPFGNLYEIFEISELLPFMYLQHSHRHPHRFSSTFRSFLACP